MSVPAMGSGAGQASRTILVLLAATAVILGVGMATGPLVGLASLPLGAQLALAFLPFSNAVPSPRSLHARQTQHP